MTDSDRNQQILALIENLRSHINQAQGLRLSHTARLLKIAVLDLQTVVWSISDEEVRRLSEMLEENIEASKRLRH